MQQPAFAVDVDHACAWALDAKRAPAGWEAQVEAIRSDLLKALGGLRGSPAAAACECLRTDAEACALLAELDCSWGACLREMTAKGLASRTITGDLSDAALAEVERAVARGRRLALAECATTLMAGVAVELPALGAAYSAASSRALELGGARADAERLAGEARRRAAREAQLLGVSLSEAAAPAAKALRECGAPGSAAAAEAESAAALSTGGASVCASPGAEAVAKAVASPAVRAAAAFARSRALAVHGPAGAAAVAVPALDEVFADADSSSEGRFERLLEPGRRTSVTEDLQVLASFLLASEQDVAAMEADRKAAGRDGGPPLAPLGAAPPAVASATRQDVAAHRAAVVTAIAALTSVHAAAAGMRVARTGEAEEGGPLWLGTVPQSLQASYLLAFRASQAGEAAASAKAEAASTEEAAATVIGRARQARAMLQEGMSAVLGRRVVLRGREGELGIPEEDV